MEPPTFLRFYDVKDQVSVLPKHSARSDFSVQPRIPEAAQTYCTTRANFALERRTSIVENSHGIHISHRVFHRLRMGGVWVAQYQKKYSICSYL